jgi:glutathione S-transferase
LPQWLSFIGSELHKGVFIPLLNPASPEGAKAYAMSNAGPRLAHLDQHLAGRSCPLSDFSIADAYLATVLNWAVALKVDLSQWPNVKAYNERMLQRPSIAKALNEERALYAEELARHGKR